MSTDLVPINAALDRQAAAVIEIAREVLRQASTPADVMEVRVRVEAAKAWAKLHKKVRQVRLDLLAIEVEALVRIVELGGEFELANHEREAALWLASLSYSDRARFVQESKQATTAVGMWRSVISAEDEHRRQADERQRGRDWASAPDCEPARDVERQVAVTDAREVLRAIIDDHCRDGDVFTIDDLTDSVLDHYSRDEDDEGFREGVRELCRKVLMNARPKTIDGTTIPKFVTARVNGEYARIPTMVATVAHLDEALALKEEQLRQDQAALDRFAAFVEKVRSEPGCTDASRVGDIIASRVDRVSAQTAGKDAA